MYTQSHPKLTEGSDVHVGTSLDQLYVQHYGQDTPIPSMQLSIEPVDQSGGCAYGYACVYTDTISWAAPDQPLPMVRDPRMVFELLFGAGGTLGAARPASRHRPQHPRHAARRRWPTCGGRSDRATGSGSISTPRTSAKSSSAFSASKRATRAARRANCRARRPACPTRSRSTSRSCSTCRCSRSRRTRRACSRSSSAATAQGRVYPGSGVDAGFHNASHHGVAEDKIREFGEINKYHVSMLPYFLEQAEEHDRGRRDAPRQDADLLRLADGDRQQPQSPQLPAHHAGQRRRRARGRHAHQGHRRHADGQRAC